MAEPTDERGTSGDDGRFVAHARTVMGLTLLSRVSGLARDATCSRIFGASPAWSAFVTAFVVPNLFRRLFGEGALSAAFLPVYARLARDDPRAAGALASLTVAAIAALLGALTLIAELALLLVLRSVDAEMPAWVIELTMVMLPFAPLVCVGAILGGVLQTHGRFTPHAAAPIVLNLCMGGAAAAGGLALGWALDRIALVVAVAVLIAGVAQVSWFIASLRGAVLWTTDLAPARDAFRSMVRALVPALIGMGALQVGTAIDGLLAGYPVLVGPTLPGGAAYPMDGSSASALFFASRLYQFPLGVFGIAIATAVFPALSRSAGDAPAFSSILERGIRTSLFISVPATVGMLLVARPLVETVYAGGAFGATDAGRVTAALVAYAPAIWAYALTHVLTRAFYATGNTTVPMAVGLGSVALNIALNLALMWPLAERGLALGTSIAATAQCLTLSWLARRRLDVIPPTPALWRSIGLTLAGGAVVLLAVLAARWVWTIDGSGWGSGALRLGRDIAAGAGSYVALALALRRPELRWLVSRGGAPASPDRGRTKGGGTP